MTCGIYAIKTRHGRWYIGSSKNIEHRISFHYCGLKCGTHSNGRLLSSYRKNGKRLWWKVLVVCREQDLLLYEQTAMGAFRPELNLSLIAGKVEFTPEVLAKAQAWKRDPVRAVPAYAKIKAANTGKFWTEERKLAWSKRQKGRLAWNKGIPLTEEHKAKLRANSQKGKKISPETAEKRKLYFLTHPGANAGKSPSLAARENMRQAQLRRYAKRRDENEQAKS
jgi:group I intron endonuclease